MARSTNILIALATGLVLTLGTPALGHGFQASPQVPEDALTTRQLIAWSGLQKPQPAPQPLPPRDTPIPQPDQPADQHVNPPIAPRGGVAAGQTFTGKIVKDGSKYCLRVGSKSYPLGEQGGLQKYEDHAVRVIGILDLNSNTIEVKRLDLIL